MIICYNLKQIEEGIMQRVPKKLPQLSILIDDLGGSIKDVANYLEVEEQTIKRWIKKEHAPRAYMLALFFVSRWGWSHVNCDAENAARISACLLASEKKTFNLKIEALNKKIDNAYLCGQLSIAFKQEHEIYPCLNINQQREYLSLNS